MKHAMIDLETLGTAGGSVILSIGGCIFDEHGPAPSPAGSFVHLVPDASQQTKLGLIVDISTIMWWLGQNPEAQQSIRKHVLSALGSGNLLDTLHKFSAWYVASDAATIWSNGADFDIPLLANLYRVAGLTAPWKYNASRCCRTIMASTGRKMGDFGTKNVLAHDALADAIYQAGEVAAALRWLKRVEQTHTDVTLAFKAATEAAQ